MGNAFLGISDDISAVSWNPAGLNRREDPYEQPVMALGYQSLSSDATFRSTPWEVEGQFDYSNSFSGWDFMSIVLPIRIKGHLFVGSVAYTRLGEEVHNGGMEVDTSMWFDVEDEISNTLRPFHYQLLNSYHSRVNALNVGFGTRLYDKLSFGLAVNVYGGTAGQTTVETSLWEELIYPMGPGNQRCDGVVMNMVYDTASFSGVYFTLGFRYAAETFSAGLIVKTPHTLRESIDVFVDRRAYVNDVEIDIAIAVHDDDHVVELDQPLMLGAGVGYNATENLLLAADVECRHYGSGKVHVRDSLRLVPGAADTEFFTEFEPYWNNAWVFRFGAEYIWNTGSRLFPTVPLRLGRQYIQVPQPNVEGGGLEFVNGQITYVPTTSLATLTKWSFGAGLRWAQIHLDAAYVISSIDQEDRFWAQKSSVDNGTLSFTFTGFF